MVRLLDVACSRNYFYGSYFLVNSIDETIISAFRNLLKYVNNWMSVSAYANVNLPNIFKGIYFGYDTEDVYSFSNQQIDGEDNDEIQLDTEMD